MNNSTIKTAFFQGKDQIYILTFVASTFDAEFVHVKKMKPKGTPELQSIDAATFQNTISAPRNAR